MISSEECIEQDRLRDHLHGSLPAEEAAAVVAHLDTCNDCQVTLELLVGEVGCVDAAREASRRPADIVGVGGDTTLLRLLAELKSQRGGAAAVAETPERLGHYRVLEIAGRGGMGVALKAFDEKLGRVVCLKVFAGSLAQSRSARRRLLREARAAAAIDSDHVVKIYAVEEEAEPPYLAMEFVAGRSLQELLDGGPLPVDRALEIGAQVAAGLAAAHAQGVVHRDIKPGNILLETETGRARITDFGLARAAHDGAVTTEGAIAGTPEYMAPEQARGAAVDYRADLFSLGSVLYAMCTGRSPFRAESSLAVLRRILDDKPPRVDRLRPDVPAGLSGLVARLHAKNPDERVQSADEVWQTLQRIAAGTFVPPRFERRTVLLSAGVMLIGAGAFAAAWTGLTPDGPSSVSLDDQIRGQIRGRVPPAAPARRPRVLVVMPPRDFYAPDYFPVCMWLATHDVKFQVVSTNMHDCQPDERSRRIAEEEGRDVRVRPDLMINYARSTDYDAIYVVGGTGCFVYASGGSHAALARNLIAGFLTEKKIVAAMGVAPIVLAEAGVLRGRRSGCYPFGEPMGIYCRRLEAAGAIWVDESVVEDGPFLTSGNPMNVEDFAQALLRRLGVEPKRYLLPEPSD